MTHELRDTIAHGEHHEPEREDDERKAQGVTTWLSESMFKWAMTFGFSSIVVLILLYMGRDFLTEIRESVSIMRDSIVRIDNTIGEIKTLATQNNQITAEIQRHDREARERDLALLRLVEKLCDCLDSKHGRPVTKPAPTLPPG